MKEQAILKLYQKYSFLNCQKTNTNTYNNNIIDLDKYELSKNIHICQDDDCCVVKNPKKEKTISDSGLKKQELLPLNLLILSHIFFLLHSQNQI